VDRELLLGIPKTTEVDDPFNTGIFGRKSKVASDYDVSLPIVGCISQTVDQVVDGPNPLHDGR
jgi:hypothetical protein